MGDVYGLAALVLGFAGVGWCFTVKLFSRQMKDPGQRGTWRRVQETVTARSSSLIRIYLVRECAGRETGRLFVAEVDSSQPDWSSRLGDAIAEADDRLAALESAEWN